MTQLTTCVSVDRCAKTNTSHLMLAVGANKQQNKKNKEKKGGMEHPMSIVVRNGWMDGASLEALATVHRGFNAHVCNDGWILLAAVNLSDCHGMSDDDIKSILFTKQRSTFSTTLVKALATLPPAGRHTRRSSDCGCVKRMDLRLELENTSRRIAKMLMEVGHGGRMVRRLYDKEERLRNRIAAEERACTTAIHSWWDAWVHFATRLSVVSKAQGMRRMQQEADGFLVRMDSMSKMMCNAVRHTSALKFHVLRGVRSSRTKLTRPVVLPQTEPQLWIEKGNVMYNSIPRDGVRREGYFCVDAKGFVVYVALYDDAQGKKVKDWVLLSLPSCPTTATKRAKTV